MRGVVVMMGGRSKGRREEVAIGGGCNQAIQMNKGIEVKVVVVVWRRVHTEILGRG
jgi:hypothetical protein